MRRKLEAMANDFLSSFISRNNDINGYWGIGVLFSLQQQNDVSSINIDLLTGQSNLNAAFEQYKENFYIQMHAKRSPNITEAQLEINFDLSKIKQSHHPFTKVHEVSCSLRISDQNRSITQSKLTWAIPHDPDRESKSTRE